MPDRKHRVDCSCHHPLHFIEIDYLEWDNLGGFPRSADIEIFFCSHRVGGFWRRFGRAFRYLFGFQDLITADVVISKEQARAAGEFLVEIADAGDKWESGEL